MEISPKNQNRESEYVKRLGIAEKKIKICVFKNFTENEILNQIRKVVDVLWELEKEKDAHSLSLFL